MSPPPPSTDQLRLLAKVARMYHERGLRQPQIASDLSISQSRVSRLLKQAAEVGIVRTTVTLPSGVYTDREEALERKYGLTDSIVVDTGGSSGAVVPALGAAAATYLGETLMGGDIVGISSWSSSLLAAAELLRPKNNATVRDVVQLFGGVGDPQVQLEATRLLDRFARVTGARPTFLPTPGIVTDARARKAMLEDPVVARVRDSWSRLTVALLGIGSVEPSPLLRQSGNAVDPEQQRELRALGAVGDVCLRFFDAQGTLVSSPFNERVLGVPPELLKAVPRRVGVAGGTNKHAAIRAALLGGWVNILVTDLGTADVLLEDQRLDSGGP